jgi:hypothetical protein
VFKRTVSKSRISKSIEDSSHMYTKKKKELISVGAQRIDKKNRR